MLNEDERSKQYLMENINRIKLITEQNIKDIGEIFVSLINGEISYFAENKRYINSVVIANLLYDGNIPNSKYDVITNYKKGLNLQCIGALHRSEEYKHIYAWIGKYIVQKINRELESMGIEQVDKPNVNNKQINEPEIPKPVVEEDIDTRSKRIANNIYQQIGSILDKSYEMSISQGENPAVILRIIDYPVLNQLVTNYQIAVPDTISKKNKYDIVNFIKLIKKTLKTNYPDVYKHFTDISKEKRNERRQTTPDDWYLTIVNNTQFQSMSPTEKLVILDLVHHIHIMKTLESPKLKTGFTYRPTYECNIDVTDRTRFGKTMGMACEMGLIKEIKRKDKTGEEISSKGLPKLYVITT